MAAGNSIFRTKYRTHTNGQLTKDDVKKRVRLSGWVHARRDHGGLIFIDLRDRWGTTQLTFDPSRNKEAWHRAEQLKREYVVAVSGTVAARPDDMVNSKLATGEIEVEVNRVVVLSKSKTLPFEIFAEREANEELRLKYRFLHLRNPRPQRILKRRDELLAHVRSYMRKHKFIEVQTPILANSSPEGARDFLVPSRLHPGTFYALPQAPQQYKQLLMVSGLDRYFQIAPCFRDEDPRADRHSGGFYQIDIEMSFVEQEDVFAVVEPLMVELTESFSDKKVAQKPFPRLSWREAMTRYGTDKPDLRYGLPITEVTDIAANSGFHVFKQAVSGGGVVHALSVPGAARFTRKEIDELTEEAKAAGAGGLAYIMVKDEPVSPILKYMDKKQAEDIIKKTNTKKGGGVFFGAGKWEVVCRVLGGVRERVALKQGLKESSQAAWCWVIDFPMYEWNEQEKKTDFSHNPFSMPQGGLKALEQAENPLDILGYQYDLVLNGFEISSGAIRNHEPATMYKAFEIAGYSKQEVDEKFGGMIRAFQYGAPPHGGIAPGVDRLLMVLWNLENIRDIYAFPKNGQAQDVMMNSPAPASPSQLKELHIKLDL